MQKQLGFNSTLQRGDKGQEVTALYIYLQNFGYLPGEPMRSLYRGFHKLSPTPKGPVRFGSRLEEAVSKYQQFHHLSITGRLDDPTLKLMRQPRCAFPDIIESEPETPVAWEKRKITYRL